MPVTNSLPPTFTSSQIILAAQAALVSGTGLDWSKVVICNNPDRVDSIQEQHCTIRLDGHNAMTYCGAGRPALRVERNLVVSLYSRSYLDIVGYNTVALTSNPLVSDVSGNPTVTGNSTMGHYGFEDQVINTFALRPLLTFAGISGITGIAMTNCPLYFLPGAVPAKARSEEDPAWFNSALSFKLDYNQTVGISSYLDGSVYSGNFKV